MATVTMHRIIIPDWVPVSVNQLTRSWRRANRLKAHDREMVAVYARVQQVPAAICKRRVSVTITVDHAGHRPDPDNLLKSLLDALVQCGRLVDDSIQWCELGPVVVEIGSMRQTVIQLEDVS